ncbi:MAG: ABC transporter substrate-binding protein [Pseudomonadota bacterium]|nr:ABC transporter substrate-binding protein [Pseudomonadota bacterium]
MTKDMRQGSRAWHVRSPWCRWLALAIACWAFGLGVAQAQSRDTVRVGLQLEPPVLDPTVTAAAVAGEVTYGNVFEGLTLIDGEGQVVPRLAREWKVSDDGLSYTFSLRSGVRFHDGKPFDAEVAAASLRRLLAPESANPHRMWFDGIARVEVTGRHTLVLHLRQPDSLLPFALALPAAVIVHPDTALGNREHPVGTGPFAFRQWRRGQSVALERFARYWGKAPALQHAQFIFLSSSVQTENMLAEGLLDVLGSVTKRTSDFIHRPDYRIVTRKVESKLILAINNARAPFNDVRARRALAHAIDRVALSQLYGDQLQPALLGSHFAPWHPAYVDLVQRYPHDPARARALLAEAGVLPGTPVTLTVPPTDYGRFGGLRVAADLEEAGLRVEIKPVDWATWMRDVFGAANYQLTLIMHVEPMDLNIYARDHYYFNYDNAAFKAIWQQVLAARDPARINELLGQAQRRLTDDAVNVFLFMRPERNFVRRGLVGLWENSPIPSFVLQDVRWEK